MSKVDSVFRISAVLLLIIPCVIPLSVNSQNATLTNAVSSNNECEEEIRLICRGMASLQILFRFTNVIQLPINTSSFINEPSFIGEGVSGCSPYAYGRPYPYGYDYVTGHVRLNTTFVNISEGKLKADVLMAEFEKLLNITLPYQGNSTRKDDSVTYSYKVPNNASSLIQKFRNVFLESESHQGFDKIITSNLLDNEVWITFDVERETGDLTWKTEVDVYIPDYISETWGGWLGDEYTISLRELADYSGNISASPNSTKSTLSIRFSIVGAFLQIFPKEEVKCLEIVPSQMNVSRGGEVFEKEITGGSVEDLYIRFKWVMPWWSLIGVTVVILGVGAFIIGFGINPLKNLFEKIPKGVLGFLFFVDLGDRHI